MDSTITATSHTLNFNSLSFDKFEDLCFWLAEDLGEYKLVERYGGTGDKNRDVIGYTHDEELDYFQCKRYEGLTYSVLESELDGISKNVQEGGIKKPRLIYFVLSSSVSSGIKDKLKSYAREVNLPDPAFWEPVILDKKVKRNPEALKNFFGISDQKEEHLPQVDVTGLIDYSLDGYRFTVVNHGDTAAIDCRWGLWGFGGEKYPGTPTTFDLKPGDTQGLRIAMHGDFMKQNPIRELRLRFKFRDNKNNWYYSERLLNVEGVHNGAFYRIKVEPGEYISAKPLEKFSIDSIEIAPRTGIRETRLVSYAHNGVSRQLKIHISSTLPSVWQFNSDGLEAAFRELAERKIAQMIKSGRFEDEFAVNTYLKPTQKTGFEAYKELRETIT